MKTLNEAEALSAEDKELLREVEAVVHALLPTAEVLLYGSVARGTRTPGSDYDILILTNESMNTKDEEEISAAVYNVELARDAVVSTQFCTKEERDLHPGMPFHREVERDGIVL